MRSGPVARLWAVVLLAATVGGAPRQADAAGGRERAAASARGGRRVRAQLWSRHRVGREVRLAARLRSKALDAEPVITRALRSTFRRTGGTLVDLDQRIKSSSSVLQKIGRDRANEGITIEQAGRQMADVLRYKVVLRFEDYEPSRRAILHDLEASGFRVVKSKNNWGTRYPGHNLQLQSPDGYIFELQLQTAESFSANKRTHELYRRFRETSGPEADQLEQRIFDVTRMVPIPPGAAAEP